MAAGARLLAMVRARARAPHMTPRCQHNRCACWRCRVLKVTSPGRGVTLYSISSSVESKPELSCSWASGHKQDVLAIAVRTRARRARCSCVRCLRDLGAPSPPQVPTRDGGGHGGHGGALTYVVTCGAADDIFVRVWSTRGEPLSAFRCALVLCRDMQPACMRAHERTRAVRPQHAPAAAQRVLCER
jgi:hypothetical protein